MKRVKYLLLRVTVIALFCAAPLSAFSAELVTLRALASSSGLFPYVVAIARALSSYYPKYVINVAESRGNVDNTLQIRSGKARLANSISQTDSESYFGVGANFKDKPFHDFRILWYYQRSLLQIAVAQDSGITTLSELNGRLFSAGGTGTSASALIHEIFEVLDIHPHYFESDQFEALNAYVENQIDGVVKIGPVPDGYITYINASRPARILSLSQSEMEKILKAIPGVRLSFLPTNVYKGIEQDDETSCLVTYHGIQSDMSFSQEDGYRFFKAMWEDGKEIWQHAYPVGKDNDIPRITLEAALTPLHAGTVQYLEEHGFYVPKELIPEEYVPVR